MASESHQEHAFHPKDAIAYTMKATFQVGGAGALVAAIQNTLTRQNVGAMGFFTRFGGTTATFAAMGASYAFASTVSANLRQKNDSWNVAVGGFLAGSMVGLTRRTMPAVLGYGSGLAITAFAFDYTRTSLSGQKNDPTVDEFERKMMMRKNRQRPIEETIAELGEGRGIYGPGYEERRRQRIKENYGIEITRPLPEERWGEHTTKS
ncbi:Threonine-tRNA ligase [Venturia nashicola]|uniref:Cytoplasmic threonine-tRNA ligase n=1 Tax=Venturia nashicola TaxID=86259 RepID=A0A4Z1NUQ0_9PEZI|nr:cytoplasmic threonine-tRNA ligase [Venturia nashicola]TLD20238.1 Threonine-tRNA ligase [Venturia nashicola]